MSLTPLDETDGHPGEDEQAAGERESNGSVTGRLLGRVRTALDHVASVLWRPFRSTETTVAEPPRRLDGDERGEPARNPPAKRPRRVVESDGVPRRFEASSAFEPAERDDGPDSDRPELVATWNDDGLTLSEPSDSDARISSDTWTEMER